MNLLCVIQKKLFIENQRELAHFVLFGSLFPFNGVVCFFIFHLAVLTKYVDVAVELIYNSNKEII